MLHLPFVITVWITGVGIGMLLGLCFRCSPLEQKKLNTRALAAMNELSKKTWVLGGVIKELHEHIVALKDHIRRLENRDDIQ